MEVLTYKDVVNEIFSHTATRHDCLKVMRKLVEHYGNPHLSMPTIHIAGTNGKGQVSAKISRALEAQGYHVGLFTSPHIEDYTERVSINGVKIPQQTVIEYWLDLKAVYLHFHLIPNFFDATTLFSFRYFASQSVDIAVIETGLGGRFDSTNVIKPLVSAITSVSHDHIDYLGASIQDIAYQKAGIIKKETPIVLGPRARFNEIIKEAELQNSQLIQVEKQACYYDIENQAVATEVLKVISDRFPVSKSSLEEGIRHSLSYRFQQEGPVIYDVAHNPDAFYRLVEALKHRYPYQHFRFVIGMSLNKDIRASIRYIDDVCNHAHFVKADPQIGADPEEIAEQFQKVSKNPFTIEKSISEAVRNAKAALNKGQLLVVCGSCFLMREAKQ
jgi:dihydrofolate synthase/folylpolyglutamate synthase